MKHIAQFTSSICGTNKIKVTDVILFNNKLLLYHRIGIDNFEFEIIDKCDYNKKKFEEFLLNPSNMSSDCNIIGIWRAAHIKNPNYLCEEYYKHIYDLYILKNNYLKNQIKEISNEINKLNVKLNENYLTNY